MVEMIQIENKSLFSQRPIAIGRKGAKGAKDTSQYEKPPLILQYPFVVMSQN